VTGDVLLRRSLTVLGAAIGVAAVVFSVASAISTTSETTGVVRVERAFVDGWHFGCHADACQAGPSPFGPIRVTSPVSEATVDVVVTVTMDYQTTRGDYGIVRMRYRESGSHAVTMRPGDFRLDSSGELTTTSLSWVARDVPGGGAEYEFSLLALPRIGPGGGDQHFHFRGRHLTVVIEMWSTG